MLSRACRHVLFVVVYFSLMKYSILLEDITVQDHLHSKMAQPAGYEPTKALENPEKVVIEKKNDIKSQRKKCHMRLVRSDRILSDVLHDPI